MSAGTEQAIWTGAAARPTGGTWVRVPARQMMHDGQVWPTWGVQVAATGQWVGRCHPIGRTPEVLTEAGALREAVTAWEEQFEAADGEAASISGADLLAWFAQWRLRAQRALAQAGAR